jgi:hypothetical protein
MNKQERLVLWSCRIAIRLLFAIWAGNRIIDCLGLVREADDLRKDLNDALWPGGKPPEVYR